MDLQASPVIKGIFWLRAVPTLLRGQPFGRRGPRGLLEETLALGFGVLAEIPDREVVVGTYTQPWHQLVTFHPLPPEQFAAFDAPGYVKIVGSSPAPGWSPPTRNREGGSGATGRRCRPGSS